MLRCKRIAVNRSIAVLCYLFAALAGAVGQFCFKKVSLLLAGGTGFQHTALSPYLWAAVLSYVSIMFFFIIGLKLWNNCSALYPVYGSTFIWAMLIAVIRLGERVTVRGIAGIALVIIGIALVNREPSYGGERLS